MTRKDLLTPAEHQIMIYVWRIAKANPKFILVRSILDCYPEDKKPAYTTLATFVKILGNKKFLTTKKVGNLLTISPKVSQESYVKKVIKYNLADFFNDDPVQMINFIAQDNVLTEEQKEAIRASLD